MQVWPEYHYKCPYEIEADGDLTTQEKLTDGQMCIWKQEVKVKL